MKDELIVGEILRAVLPLIFLGALVFFVTLGAFLNYHWTKFELTLAQARRIRKIFFGGAGALMAVMAITGLIYIF